MEEQENQQFIELNLLRVLQNVSIILLEGEKLEVNLAKLLHLFKIQSSTLILVLLPMRYEAEEHELNLLNLVIVTLLVDAEIIA